MKGMKEQLYPDIDKAVIFTLEDLFYALPLDSVIRIIHAIEVSRLPKAPAIIEGIINVRGRIMAVVDMRKRFGVVSREMSIDDNLIIVKTEKRELALWVDTVSGINEIMPGKYSDTKVALPYAEYIKGVAKTEEGIILIYDLEQCLNLAEEMELEQALSK
jgi:purine-binding chemotaxis protein CheW